MAQNDTTKRIPKQKRSQKTLERIIEIGKVVFSRDGYHNTSTKKIAAEAGVSVGSFYNYFPDKKALLIEVYRRHVTEVHGMVAGAMQNADFTSGDSLEVTRAIVGHALRLHTYSPAFHKEISMMRYSDPDIEKLQAEETGRVAQMMVLMLKDAPRLRVDDLEAAAHVVTSAVEEVVHSIKMFQAPVEESRLIDALADMIHRFLFE